MADSLFVPAQIHAQPLCRQQRIGTTTRPDYPERCSRSPWRPGRGPDRIALSVGEGVTPRRPSAREVASWWTPPPSGQPAFGCCFMAKDPAGRLVTLAVDV